MNTPNALVPPPCSPLARGVYRAPYLTADGRPIYFTVTTAGRLCGEAILPPTAGQDAAAEAVAALWRQLDKVDPEHSRRRRAG